MNILEEYKALAVVGRWKEALPVIENIVNTHTGIDASWFNYGVCLDALERHREAANAFIKAHELNRTDGGIHYRILRSLFMDNDLDQSYQFCEYLCETFPDIRQTLFDSDEYLEFIKYKPFKELIEKYA